MVFGLEGLELTKDEMTFFSRESPWGFILFARNIDNPEQVKNLTAQLRVCVGRDDAPIFIDQEGGRVQRFCPPHWKKYPSAAMLGELYARDKTQGARATWLHARLLAFDLLALGVTVNCMPVLDVPSPDGHDVIGDRAYSTNVAQVSCHGSLACEGLLAGGVKPVLKHIPGHGRATADSHFNLPIIETDLESLTKTDFVPFVDLKHIDMAMTAHVIYTAVDADQPATASKKVMNEIIRRQMGYEGLIITDDITMNALSGDLTQRTQSVFAAGCDIVLHCTGRMNEMKEVANATPFLSGTALQRAQKALLGIGKTDEVNEADCRAEFEQIMSQTLVAGHGHSVADPTNYGPTSGANKNGNIA